NRLRFPPRENMIDRILCTRIGRKGLGPWHTVIRTCTLPGIPVFYVRGCMFIAGPPPIMPPSGMDYRTIITVDKCGLCIGAPWPAEVHRSVFRLAAQLAIQKNKAESAGIRCRRRGDIRCAFLTEQRAAVKHGRCSAEDK